MPPSFSDHASSVPERIRSVFQFLSAFHDLRASTILDINDYAHHLWLHDLPTHPSIERVYQETVVEQPGAPEETIVLRVSRPVLTPCPPPPDIIQDWITSTWQDCTNDLHVQEQHKTHVEGLEIVEPFEQDTNRVQALEAWRIERTAWQEREQPAVAAMTFFQQLYEWYGLLEREGEQMELLIGDGILSHPDAKRDARHPLLLAKLELEFFPGKQHPLFILRRREHPPELALDLLRSFADANISQLTACTQELTLGEHDPLGQSDTEGFLRRVIQGVFPQAGTLTNDPSSMPEQVTVSRDPVLFIRPRRIGLHHHIEAALEDLEHRLKTNEPLPEALTQLLSTTAHETETVTDQSMDAIAESRLAERDILYSRPANSEQIQIAARLARSGGVVVQGPPGTGKTHTIANLIGHLLAQGKRILVTAQTPKALRVLREKIVPGLQPLCVSVLQKDRQNQDELQQAVRGIHERLADDVDILLRDAERLRQERQHLLTQQDTLTGQILHAREDEGRDLIVNGVAFQPTQAAKHVQSAQSRDGWIPGPLNAGEHLPLSHAEIADLYGMHATIRLEDERELEQTHPSLQDIPSPDVFTAYRDLLEQTGIVAQEETTSYWNSSSTNLATLEATQAALASASQFLQHAPPWQQEIIQAGRDGEAAKQPWTAFIALIETAWNDIQEGKALITKYGPTLHSSTSLSDARALTEAVVTYLTSGHTLGWTTRLTKASWHQFAETVQINGQPLDLNNLDHWKAVRDHVRTLSHRQELRLRWERLMTANGAPRLEDERPEQVCKEYVKTIDLSLRWHEDIWMPLQRAFVEMGFDWEQALEHTRNIPETRRPLQRLHDALADRFPLLLQQRLNVLHRDRAETFFATSGSFFREERFAGSRIAQTLATACFSYDHSLYQAGYAALQRLTGLERLFRKRQDLLTSLANTAPQWAAAIRQRLPGHDSPTPPGDPEAAWVWRQLYEELERRTATSMESLQTSLEDVRQDLLRITALLIEKQTWAYQVQHVSAEQRRALGAYSTLRTKLTKSGQGKREPEIRAAIRKEMETAKHAVPVWIMPLNEVIETYDPRSTRFDVVIIDEASQCDASAMLALSLGRQCVIVGDDEQVTPVSVGVNATDVTGAARAYLSQVPHKELYDGETSIYEFARISFGHVVRLVEHFRCAPDIIAFSNALCYQNEIKPLREEAAFSLQPACVAYPVEATIQGSINIQEAQVITSLVCAAIEEPEYQSNDQGRPMSFGISCLVGEQQINKIQEWLHHKLPPEVYNERRILCGTPAQFQGDERDVMFLSMVEASGNGPLALRDAEANKRIFKKRYNVATSRARDQLWLVYSLRPEIDLKPGDIRRRLIEHIQDPKAWQRQLEYTQVKTESVFEAEVLQRLMTGGYRVIPQYTVGAYRIDLVVQGQGQRLAIECDGDAWHTSEQLRDDMERQAILERLGWKFVRIRGSLFFREPERAMEPVFERLRALNIQPESSTPVSAPSVTPELIARVSRRAAALRQEWGWGS